jgi:hypothetical protein
VSGDDVRAREKYVEEVPVNERAEAQEPDELVEKKRALMSVELPDEDQ